MKLTPAYLTRRFSAATEARPLMGRLGCIRQMVVVQTFTAAALRPSPRSGRSLQLKRPSGEKVAE